MQLYSSNVVICQVKVLARIVGSVVICVVLRGAMRHGDLQTRTVPEIGTDAVV